MSAVEDRTESESMTEVLTRLRKLEDMEEIRKVFFAYGKLADTKDWVGYSDLFAEDGVFDSQHSVGTVTGSKEIRERLGSAYAGDPADGIHLFHNIEIDVEGDRATASSFWSYLRPGQNGYPPQLLMMGHYDDVLVRTAKGWKFQLRKCQI